jgi:serine/threonine protein kinase/tetratricopeptide (TPR) repeat protein
VIGETLHHYTIVGRLGKGGMGEVYVAEDAKLKRRVALKILPSDLAEGPRRRARFEREAQIVAALNHANIVTIYSVEEARGIHFFTMELVDGKTLTESIPTGGLPLDRLLEIAIPLTDAVSAAHRSGILHRDLKPDNVMIDREGRLKVLDFGLAKPQGTLESDEGKVATASVTLEGKIMGTLAYMSPEQAEGKPVDARSDVFSLGTILYEMSTGRKPFVGDTSISTITAILRDEPDPVTELNPRVPRQLGRIVQLCLAKEPDQRYQTALDIRNELRQLQKEAYSGEWTAVPSAESPARSPSLPRRWAVIATLVAVVAVAALLWTMSRDGEDSAPAGTIVGADTSVGIIGFENLSDPDDPERVGRMLTSMVTTHLTETGGLTVASTPKVLSARRQVTGQESHRFDTARATEVAREAGVEIMLVGQVAQVGDDLILTAELVDVDTGDTLGSIHREARSTAELFTLAAAIAGEIRSQLGAGVDELVESRFDLADALTDSPRAYRHYAAGETLLHQGRYREATEELFHATREDPTFALARYRLGLALWWDNRDTEAYQVLQDGRPHTERLPEHWRAAYGGILGFVKGEIDAACELLQRAAPAPHNVPDLYYLLGECMSHYGPLVDPAEARLLFERALEIDPTFEVVLDHLVGAMIEQQDWEAADRLLARYRENDPANRNVSVCEMKLMNARARYDEAIPLGEGLVAGEPPMGWITLAAAYAGAGRWDSILPVVEDASRAGLLFPAEVLQQRASAHIGTGRLREALVDLEQASEAYAESLQTWNSLPHAAELDLRAQVLAAVGDLDGGINIARRALRIEPLFYPAHYTLVRMLLAADRDSEARTTAEALEDMPRGPMTPFWVHAARVELALAGGDAETARVELDEAVARAVEYRHAFLEQLLRGRVNAAHGDFERSIAAYRGAIGTGHTWTNYQVVGTDVARILAYVELAGVEERAGDTQAAIADYRAFLDRWGNANLAVPTVERARARHAALGG